MAALWNRAGHYIFELWFFLWSILYLLFFSSPNLSRCRLDNTARPSGHTSTHGLSANVGCRSETCCTRLAENSGRKKSPKNRHLCTIAQLLLGYILETKAHMDNRTKLVTQQYLPQMSSQYGELRPTNGWDWSSSLGHPSKFQRVSRLGSVTAQYSSSGRQPSFAALNGGRHYIRQGGHHVGHRPTF